MKPTDEVIAEPIDQSRELARWQRRLLPFMITAISVMGIFFFASSLIQLARFGDSVAYRPNTEVANSIAAFEKANPESLRDSGHAQWRTLVALEEAAIRQRYAQVNATLMLRAWTRHLGFLTGMILSLVGTIFILAKLSERETKLSFESTGVKGALASSSPGIIFAVLGTALMMVTLTASFEFSTRDVPVYLEPQGGAEMAPALPLDSEEARDSEERALFPQEDSNGQANSIR